MKRIYPILSLLLFSLLTSPIAEARFGGGRSFGRHYTTAHHRPIINSGFSGYRGTRDKGNSRYYQTDVNTQRPERSFRKGALMGAVGGLVAGGAIGSMMHNNHNGDSYSNGYSDGYNNNNDNYHHNDDDLGYNNNVYKENVYKENAADTLNSASQDLDNIQYQTPHQDHNRFRWFNVLLFIFVLAALYTLYQKVYRRQNTFDSQTTRINDPLLNRTTERKTDNAHRNTGFFEHLLPDSTDNHQRMSQYDGGFSTLGFDPSNPVPMRFVRGFDERTFLLGMCEYYRLLQQAWDRNDFAKIQAYVSQDVLNKLKAERAYLNKEDTQILFVDAQIGRADHDQYKAQLSVQFSGRYRDGCQQIGSNITDIWHLEKELGGDFPWVIVGIER